jgi:hypothetical protein
MSEIIKNHEHIAEPESHHEDSEHHREKRNEHAELKEIEQIKEDVERQRPAESAKLLDELKPVEQEKKVFPANKELKRAALNNYLSDIRSHLRGSSKAFSKFIHKPSIDTISEVAGKTIVRPTAILFGGLFMFVGSALYLYATYHTNARYNFVVALFLFFGGFMAGIVVELFYNLFFKKEI